MLSFDLKKWIIQVPFKPAYVEITYRGVGGQVLQVECSDVLPIVGAEGLKSS
jgi:hypothetical protein